MEAATASGGEVSSGDAGGTVGDVGMLCRRNALPNVLDETVTKMPAGSAVSALARLHSIHGGWLTGWLATIRQKCISAFGARL